MTPIGFGRAGVPIIGKTVPRHVAGYHLPALTGVRGSKLTRGIQRYVAPTRIHQDPSPGEILEIEFFLGIKREPAEEYLAAQRQNQHWEGLYIGDPDTHLYGDPHSPVWGDIIEKGRLRIAQQWGFRQSASGCAPSESYGPFFMHPFTPSTWSLKTGKFPNVVGGLVGGWFNIGFIAWMPTDDPTFPTSQADLALDGICLIPRVDPERNVHVLKHLEDKGGFFFDFWEGGEPGPREIETLAAENAVGERHRVIDEKGDVELTPEDQPYCVWQEVFSKWTNPGWPAKWGFPRMSAISSDDLIHDGGSFRGTGVCVDIPINLAGLAQKPLKEPWLPAPPMPLIEPGMKGWLLYSVKSCPGFACTEGYPSEGSWATENEEGNRFHTYSEIVLGKAVRPGLVKASGDPTHGMVRVS